MNLFQPKNWIISDWAKQRIEIEYTRMPKNSRKNRDDADELGNKRDKGWGATSSTKASSIMLVNYGT